MIDSKAFLYIFFIKNIEIIIPFFVKNDNNFKSDRKKEKLPEKCEGMRITKLLSTCA